ncbi:unknown protein [Desulfotalea psychrophila LSv54]|uniref:Uncharacterized protein n=1 Tax=Desulfotalea psychrophila (strain LSv54 / DSM 12343) TaxID=177439 RepID=Q6AR75_DESPS|nr:unknown protein [Desulfotalea psychrophila LSv54]
MCLGFWISSIYCLYIYMVKGGLSRPSSILLLFQCLKPSCGWFCAVPWRPASCLVWENFQSITLSLFYPVLFYESGKLAFVA